MRCRGGAKVLDQGGGQFFLVGRQNSYVVQIGSYLKLLFFYHFILTNLWIVHGSMIHEVLSKP